MRFSPEGRYVLATDGSAFTVLSVGPLVILFHSSVRDPDLPGFTQGSRQVVLVGSVAALRAGDAHFALLDAQPRLERWSVLVPIHLNRGVSCQEIFGDVHEAQYPCAFG